MDTERPREIPFAGTTRGPRIAMQMQTPTNRTSLLPWMAMVVGAVAVLFSSVGADAKPRKTALIIDANTGRTLHAEHPDAAVYPASLTKLMTIYLAFEAIEHHKLSWNTRIRISKHAAAQQPSKLGLKPGSTIAVKDAIRILITKSANDIAVAMAEHMAGSERAFARRMTRKALILGMRHTTFRNASGLPNHEQVTTARDMATLGLQLYDKFPQHFHLFGLRRFAFHGRVYRNHNGLLGRFPGANGMKTGYIRASGFNLVASVRRNRRHVIGVVFGGRTARRRNAWMRRLVTAALPHASTIRSRRRRAPQRIASPRVAVATPPRPVRAPAPVRVARVRPVDVLGRRNNVSPRRATYYRVPAATASLPAPAHTTAATDARGRRYGRPPSTLGAQARRLAAAGYPPAPVPATRAGYAHTRSALGASPNAGGYEIQVGAFRSPVDARHRLANVRMKMPQLLRGAQPYIPATTSTSGRFYRARFAGFNAAAATHACTELRRRSVDCYVARAR